MEPDKYELIKSGGMWEVWKNDLFVCACIKKTWAQRIVKSLPSYVGK